MKDLRIVIVSWNAQDHLGPCLASLPRACEGLDWDCMVVDNHSTDDTVSVAHGFAERDERIDLIANQTNHGFAFACNQGAAKHDSRYVLLLNPDTECPPGSLAALVKSADSNPKVGIMGPKLSYPDGGYQYSARRFPKLKDQSLIMLKLHHVFQKAESLRRYFFLDLDKDKAQAVDQVMGACFLVRGELWDQTRGLDQRYFIWFEEVDMCRQAIKHGWLVWYEPSVTVIHHEGQAFAQVFSWRRQRYFNDSLGKYMRKWHGFWAWLAVTILHPISLAEAAIITPLMLPPSIRKKSSVPTALPCEKQKKTFYGWLAAIILLEIISALVQGWPLGQTIACIAAALLILCISFKRPAIGLAAVMAEVMVGGFGYLLNILANVFMRGISLRMALMAGFFIGWGLNAIKAKVWQYWRLNELAILQVWVFLAGMVLGGLLRGWQLHQSFIFQDFNAWLFLLYFVPTLDVAHRFGRDLKRQAAGAALAALLWLPIEILLLFYSFTHGLPWSDWLYTWIRDTRIGEITDLGGMGFRIFCQSSIYAVLCLPVIFAWWSEKGVFNRKENVEVSGSAKRCLAMRLFVPTIMVLSIASLLLSLSRSFWLGACLALASALGLVFFQKKNGIKRLIKLIAATVLSLLGSIVLILIVWHIPIPRLPSTEVWDIFADRATVSDPAAASRWNLLPAMLQKIKADPVIGAGLGSTVSYQSRDPRLTQIGSGWYTTYSFEWGWLAFWIKFGIFGVLIMGWLMVSVAWRAWKSDYAWWIRTGIVAATVGICVVHFLTPYLDHPLGFTWILGVEGLLAIKREEINPVL